MKPINLLSATLLSLCAALVHAQGYGEPQAPLGSMPAEPENPADPEQQLEPAQPDWSRPERSQPDQHPAESATGQAPLENRTEGFVARSGFTTEVRDHEPVDNLATVKVPQDKIYFFTELKDFEGRIVKHRWLYQGDIISEISFDVGGPRWRVWSSKELQPELLGIWTVEVINENGEVIAAESIEYKEEEKGFPSHEEVPPVNLGALSAS